VQDRGADRRAARLPEQQCGTGIDVDEDFLDRDLRRPVLGNDFGQALEYRFQAPVERGVGCPDPAAGDVGELVPVPVDDAKTGNA
jgi:hypothetical protein